MNKNNSRAIHGRNFLHRFFVYGQKRRRLKGKNIALRVAKITTFEPRMAGFFAFLCDTGSLETGTFVLKFCCYPLHMTEQIKNRICSTHAPSFCGYGNSFIPISQDDVITVVLLEGLKARHGTSEAQLQLR